MRGLHLLTCSNFSIHPQAPTQSTHLTSKMRRTGHNKGSGLTYFFQVHEGVSATLDAGSSGGSLWLSSQLVFDIFFAEYLNWSTRLCLAAVQKLRNSGRQFNQTPDLPD